MTIWSGYNIIFSNTPRLLLVSFFSFLAGGPSHMYVFSLQVCLYHPPCLSPILFLYLHPPKAEMQCEL